jgi:NADH dehydrogenase
MNMGLPFYVPGKESPRIVIVGGGYSGLAALSTLREHAPDADIVLVDQRPDHLKITHLHESFRRPLTDLLIPFSIVERRFGIRHIQAEVTLDVGALAQWNADRLLPISGETVEFDYLLLALGAASKSLKKGPNDLNLSDFSRQSGPELLDERLGADHAAGGFVTVVGGGATGIQFLFEIAHWLRSHQSSRRLRLVDADAAPLSQFNPRLGRYAAAKMADLGIEHLPGYFFRGQEADRIILEQRDSGDSLELPSELSLLFVGKEPLVRLETNWFGQVMADGSALDRIFAAGDCSRYRRPGSNALSAQNAVRKGKLAARNILRHSGEIKVLEPYVHREMGYVVSLGPTDAIGWIGLERNVVGGQPATLVKEVVEAQYDLLLAGVDTYLL